MNTNSNVIVYTFWISHGTTAGTTIHWFPLSFRSTQNFLNNFWSICTFENYLNCCTLCSACVWHYVTTRRSGRVATVCCNVKESLNAIMSNEKIQNLYIKLYIHAYLSTTLYTFICSIQTTGNLNLLAAKYTLYALYSSFS